MRVPTAPGDPVFTRTGVRAAVEWRPPALMVRAVRRDSLSCAGHQMIKVRLTSSKLRRTSLPIHATRGFRIRIGFLSPICRGGCGNRAPHGPERGL